MLLFILYIHSISLLEEKERKKKKTHCCCCTVYSVVRRRGTSFVRRLRHTRQHKCIMERESKRLLPSFREIQSQKSDGVIIHWAGLGWATPVQKPPVHLYRRIYFLLPPPTYTTDRTLSIPHFILLAPLSFLLMYISTLSLLFKNALLYSLRLLLRVYVWERGREAARNGPKSRGMRPPLLHQQHSSCDAVVIFLTPASFLPSCGI